VGVNCDGDLTAGAGRREATGIRGFDGDPETEGAARCFFLPSFFPFFLLLLLLLQTTTTTQTTKQTTKQTTT
jgi:hypothetical protein